MSGLDDRTEKLLELGREVLFPVSETFECLGCDGRGEVYAGYRDPETNAPVGIRCMFCDGAGHVDVEQVICDMCEQPTPGDDICPHRTANLCPACALDACPECASISLCADDEPAWWVAS